jgi:hypothetical protein
MVKGPQGKLPIYDNPPLVELVIGARFAKLEAFKVPHFGLFWNSIIDEFPRCEEAAPYATEAAELETNLPLPRVWLINAADDHLLQMQKELFCWTGDKKKVHIRTLTRLSQCMTGILAILTVSWLITQSGQQISSRMN